MATPFESVVVTTVLSWTAERAAAPFQFVGSTGAGTSPKSIGNWVKGREGLACSRCLRGCGRQIFRIPDSCASNQRRQRTLGRPAPQRSAKRPVESGSVVLRLGRARWGGGRRGIGDAGFGTREGYCELNNPGDVRTEWPLETDLLVRKTLELPVGTTDVVVYVAVDNDVQVFINGYDISDGLQTHEECPSLNSFTFAVPDSLLQVGTNLLAVRARDRGGLASKLVPTCKRLSGTAKVKLSRL